jgi:hypothetical protein
MLNRIVSTFLRKASEIVVNKVVSEVERALDEPVSLRREDRKRARKLLPLLMRSHESSDWVRLPGPPGRAGFLAAAHRFLVERPEEWAVVGLGTVAGRSFVKEAFVRKGRVGSVGLPVSSSLASTPTLLDPCARRHVARYGRERKCLARTSRSLTVAVRMRVYPYRDREGAGLILARAVRFDCANSQAADAHGRPRRRARDPRLHGR